MLQLIALERVPSELAFPPLRETKEIQEELPEGTLVFSFLVTSRNVHAFALSKSRYGSFTVAQPAKVKADVVEMLRNLGQHDRNQPVQIDDLKNTAWQCSGGAAARPTNQQHAARRLGPLSRAGDHSRWRALVFAIRSPAAADGIQFDPAPLAIANSLCPHAIAGVARPPGQSSPGRTAVVKGKLLPRDEDSVGVAAAEAVMRGNPWHCGHSY